MEINTQQPRGTDCYSHFVQTSRDGPGDGSAGHHLCPAGDSLATAWALLLSVGTGMGRLHLSLPSGCAQGATFTHGLQSAGSIPVGACHSYSKNWWVSRGKVRKGEGCVRGRISQAVSIHTLITLQCRPEERGQSLLLPAVSPLSWGRENTWLNGQT